MLEWWISKCTVSRESRISRESSSAKENLCRDAFFMYRKKQAGLFRLPLCCVARCIFHQPPKQQASGTVWLSTLVNARKANAVPSFLLICGHGKMQPTKGYHLSCPKTTGKDAYRTLAFAGLPFSVSFLVFTREVSIELSVKLILYWWCLSIVSRCVVNSPLRGFCSLGFFLASF